MGTCVIQVMLQMLCNYNYIVVTKVQPVLIKISQIIHPRSDHEFWKSAFEIVANDFNKHVSFIHPKNSSVHGEPTNPGIMISLTNAFEIKALCYDKHWIIGEDPECPIPPYATLQDDLQLSDEDDTGKISLK